MKNVTKHIFFLILLINTSCKNYYNDMIDWADNLEADLSIEEVKEQQPDFFEIDWDNPQVFENEIRYLIFDIKGNNDTLGMNNFLVFIDNKYQGRFAHK